MLYELNKEKNYYYDLKDSIYHIIHYLNNSIDSLKQASAGIQGVYSIDNNSGDNNKINNIRNGLIERRDSLEGTIIPAIEIKIDELRKSIEEEEMRLTRM